MKTAFSLITGTIVINLSANAFAATASDMEDLIHDDERVEVVTTRGLTDDELDEIGGKSKSLKKIKIVGKAVGKSITVLKVGVPVARVVGDEAGRLIAIHLDKNPDPGHTEVRKLVETGKKKVQSALEIANSLWRK